MLVLSNISFPGPEEKHLSFSPAQVYCDVQGLPVNSHFGPRVLGETSPKFEDANAATKLPYKLILKKFND
jgi:hypothetical protein